MLEKKMRSREIEKIGGGREDKRDYLKVEVF